MTTGGQMEDDPAEAGPSPCTSKATATALLR